MNFITFHSYWERHNPYIGNVIIPTDSYFLEGLKLNHQAVNDGGNSWSIATYHPESTGGNLRGATATFIPKLRMDSCWFVVTGTSLDYDFPETVGNVIIPTDELSIIFQRGRWLNHQPGTESFSFCLHRPLGWADGEGWLKISSGNATFASGKRTKNYGKSPFLMGKSTINDHFQ